MVSRSSHRLLVVPFILMIGILLSSLAGGALAKTPAPDPYGDYGRPSSAYEGDPGDGVLNPADLESSGVDEERSISSGLIYDVRTDLTRTGGSVWLVPMPAPPGSPWPVIFRLMRVDTNSAPGSYDGFGSRGPVRRTGGRRWRYAP